MSGYRIVIRPRLQTIQRDTRISDPASACYHAPLVILHGPPTNTKALFMGRSWFPFGGGAAKRQVCAVVAASPPVSYRHAVEGKGSEDDVEWRSYRRYWEGEIWMTLKNVTKD